MKRYALWMAVLALAAGCQTSGPQQFKPMNVLAPYGTTRVPPPPTGSYGKPDPYYQPPANQIGATSPGGSAPERSSSSQFAATSTRQESAGRQATGNSAVRLTSAEEEIRPTRSLSPTTRDRHSRANESPVRIVEGRGNTTSDFRSRLKGMPVSDATQGTEPGRFVPPAQMRELTQFPRATTPQTRADDRPPAQSNGSPSEPRNRRLSDATRVTGSGWQRRSSNTGLRFAER